MGYDVTFHPFSRKEFHFYIERVVDDPTDYGLQLMGLHDDPEEHAFLTDAIYSRFGRFKAQILAGTMDFEKGIGSCMASIFGYLHPYWYSRGGMLSRLYEAPFNAYRGDIADLVSGPSKPVFDKAYGAIMENYSSGVYVPYEKIAHLQQLLKDPANAAMVEEVIGGSNIASLLECLQYCLAHRLDLLEATDVYVPISGECSTLPANMRAEYLKNITDHSNSGRSKRH